MIKTVIADDELWVCNLIRDMVDWESLGFTIVGLAYDGEQLLQIAETQDPDLIITDIRMPGISGLEAIDELKKRGCSASVIVVSGYSDFEYAKSSINLGVFAYLLKPLEKDELTKTLLNFKDSIYNVKDTKNKLFELENKLSEIVSSQFYMYMGNMLRGDVSAISAENANRQYSRTFAPGGYRVVVVSVDSHIQDDNVYPKIFSHITERFFSVFKPVCSDVFYIEQQPHYLFVLNYPIEETKLIQSLLKDLAKECNTTIPYVSSSRVTLGVGHAVTDFFTLPQSYESAKNAIHSRLVPDSESLIYGEDDSVSVSISNEAKSQIAFYLNSYFPSGNPMTIVNKVFETYTANAPKHAAFDVAKCLYDISIAAVSTGARKKYYESHSEKGDMKALEQIADLRSLKQFSIDILTILKDLNASQSGKYSAIDIVKNYIDEHLDQDISLNDLAELIHLNPNYLCEQFKKETGENFGKYITYKRIETAKSMLTDITVKISSIAKRVGYNDVNYFNRVFKSYVGLTPKQYRKMFIER